jgi:hypothetical protein
MVMELEPIVYRIREEFREMGRDRLAGGVCVPRWTPAGAVTRAEI